MRPSGTPPTSARSRLAVAALTCAALALGAAAPAAASAAGASPSNPAGPTTARAAAPVVPGALPVGWSFADGGARLLWTAPTPVPLGGARLEVHADGAVLGVATLRPDRRTVSVAVGPDAVRDLASLQVVAAGRRLDAGPTSLAAAARTAARAAPQPSRTASGEASPGARSAPQAARPPAVPAAADPGRPGPYRTRTGEYTLADLPVADLPAKIEMRAVVVSPVGAPGRRPLALFLHGRHEPCYFVAGDPDTFPEEFWPCPTGWKPVPSYRGYLQSQRLLASQGWLTVSVSANGINAQDFASADGGAQVRSELVRAHLAQWARWVSSSARWAAAPAAVRSGPRPDLDRVLLVGHSRGGEGVNRAALDSAVDPKAGWTIKGQLLLAPTAFGRNPAPGVPTAVVLPYCDGDVFDLQGQSFLDDARDLVSNDRSLRSAVLVLGANHNFFNVEWTPGESVAPSVDDWFAADDPTCGTSAPNRLTPAQQRAVGATYVAAAARALVGRDTTVEPLLDGSAVRAASAGPAVVRTHALGARRTGLVVPGSERRVVASGAVRARSCDVEPDDGATDGCLADDTLFGATPHFPLDFFGVQGAPSRRAFDVSWTSGGGSARVDLRRSVSLRDADDLALRVIVPTNAPATRFAVRLTDRTGGRAVVGEAAVTGLPGAVAGTDGMPGKYWAQEVRLRLDDATLAAAGLDLAHVRALELLPRSAKGRLWLLDGWGRDPGLARDRTVPFVRVDVGTLTVQEGDAGTREVRLPVTVTGRLDRAAKVWIGAADVTGAPLPAGLPKVVTIPAGTRRLDIRAGVAGDTVDDEDVRGLDLFVRGVRSAVGGSWIGGLRILDDDPAPALTVTPAARAAEGAPLTWTLTLAAPSNRFVGVPFRLTPAPAGVTPIMSDDVPASWLTDQGLEAPPSPPVPLAELPLFLFAQIEPGRTTATLEIPTVADPRVEGAEQVVLRIPAAGEQFPGDPGVPGLPGGATVTGTLTDAA